MAVHFTLRTVLVIALAILCVADDRRAQFEALKSASARKYTTMEEESAGFAAFQANIQRVADLRVGNPLATFDLTPRNFDRTPKKSAKAPQQRPRTPSQPGAPVFLTSAMVAPPAKVDWRSAGAIAAPPNMGECGGACVGMVVAGNIEGAYFVKNRANMQALVPVSAEQLLDCPPINDGCNGGELMGTYAWVLKNNNGEVATSASYPWIGGGAQCQNGSFPIGAKIAGVLSVPKTVEALAAYTAQYGPIAAAIDATALDFYTGGILTSCSNDTMDDAVLVAGYDDTASTPYWLLRNSWGEDWGESGYVRVAKHGEACGVTSGAITAIAADANGYPITDPPLRQNGPAPDDNEKRTAIIAGAAGACVFVVIVASALIVHHRRSATTRAVQHTTEMTQELIRDGANPAGTEYRQYEAPV